MAAMRAHAGTWALVTALLVNLPASGKAGPILYNFALVADTSSAFEALGPFISMNSAGAVAFKADLRSGNRGIFVGSGGRITFIAETISPPSQFGGTSINDSGIVAFTRTLTTASNGVFVGSGGPITTIAIGSFQTFPSINNGNLVVFGTGDRI